jgi:3-oxoadipate enol-lactonase/4-carboxymuconolactone decarboxylase
MRQPCRHRGERDIRDIDATERAMPFVTRDKAKLYWRSDGDPRRPALLLGNSLGTDHALWDAVMPALMRHFRVLRFDMRGHGESDVSPGDYTIEILARDALAVADAAGATSFCYAGLSIGGMIGQWIGANAGDRVLRLVLSNTSAKLDSAAMDERIAKVRFGGTAAVVDAVLQRWFSARLLARNDERVASVRAVFESIERKGYIGCAAAVRDMDLRDLAPRIEAPTLVITGAHDLAAPKEHGEAIAAEIAGAELVELPCAHIPVVEIPGLYAHALLAFLVREGVTTERKRFDVGLARRKQALGAAYVEQKLKGVTPFTAEFQDLVTRLAWGELWTRDVLDDRTRRMLVLAMTLALGRWEEFELHARAGLDAELADYELKEVLLLAAVYCGVPAANTAFGKAQKLLEQRDSRQLP